MGPYRPQETRLFRRCVGMALAGIAREFPCQIPLVLSSSTSFERPRDWMPTFFGCYDWHSAVHSHWLLVRWLSVGNLATMQSADVISALESSFAAEKLAAEYQFVNHPDRAGFELPYGLAWLLQVTAEIRTFSHPLSRVWLNHLQPLEELAVKRFRAWLPRLLAPVRTGEHAQTAFALGLLHDWAQDACEPAVTSLVRDTALRFYFADRDLPLRFEPGGYDFLSPSLATADLMRRFLEPPEYANWLSNALPGLADDSALQPVAIPGDLRDGKLAHFAGLNFSRAWMLEGMSAGLPNDDSRRPSLQAMAKAHLEFGLPVLECNEYSVTHWVGSFATYALTQRGIRSAVRQEM